MYLEQCVLLIMSYRTALPCLSFVGWVERSDTQQNQRWVSRCSTHPTRWVGHLSRGNGQVAQSHGLFSLEVALGEVMVKAGHACD
jgi:hypothetical protein